MAAPDVLQLVDGDRWYPGSLNEALLKPRALRNLACRMMRCATIKCNRSDRVMSLWFAGSASLHKQHCLEFVRSNLGPPNIRKLLDKNNRLDKLCPWLEIYIYILLDVSEYRRTTVSLHSLPCWILSIFRCRDGMAIIPKRRWTSAPTALDLKFKGAGRCSKGKPPQMVPRFWCCMLEYSRSDLMGFAWPRRASVKMALMDKWYPSLCNNKWETKIYTAITIIRVHPFWGHGQVYPRYESTHAWYNIHYTAQRLPNSNQ